MSAERQMPLEKPSEPVVKIWDANSFSPYLHATIAEHNALARAFLQLRAEVEALRKEVERLNNVIHENRRCDPRYCTFGNAPQDQHGHKLRAAEARAEASEASRAALVKMLNHYGQHTENCVPGQGAYDEPPEPCSCGFDEALVDAALAPPAQEDEGPMLTFEGSVLP